MTPCEPQHTVENYQTNKYLQPTTPLVLQILPYPNQTNLLHTLPYQKWVTLHTQGQPEITARGTVDAGSQANVIDAALWAANQVVLGPLEPSKTLLRVADGKASKCLGRWTGQIVLAHSTLCTVFEVFDSGGAFEVLLGKPWLTQVSATQSFTDDTLHLPGAEQPIPNGYPLNEEPEYPGTRRPSPEALSEPKAEDERAATKEQVAPKEEPASGAEVEPGPVTDSAGGGQDGLMQTGEDTERKPKIRRRQRNVLTGERRRSERIARMGNRYWVPETQVALLEEVTGMGNVKMGEVREGQAPEDKLRAAADRAERAVKRRGKVEAEIGAAEAEVLGIGQEEHDAHLPVNQSQRRQDPFAAERVAKILGRVSIGEGLKEDEKARVRALIAEFADVFALDRQERSSAREWLKSHSRNPSEHGCTPRWRRWRPQT